MVVLPDGSYLNVIGGVTLRIIEARITATTRDGRVSATATGWPPRCWTTASTPPRHW